MTTIRLTKPQLDFVATTEPFPAFVAGFGAGKTQAAIIRTMVLKLKYPLQNVAYYLPTYDLVRNVAFPRFAEALEMFGMTGTLNRSEATLEVEGHGKVIFRTMDTPERIVGYEVADSILDELDTLGTEKARDVWNKVLARNRQKKPDNSPNTVGVATTPEGYRFVYERWHRNKADGYHLIRASTQSNARNLPDGYIEALQAAYSPQLLDAYLGGHFVNLTAGSVYPEFNRALNYSSEVVQGNEALHVGMDFNVSHGAAAIHVLRGDEPHAVAELTEVFDTPAMIALLKRDFPNNRIMVYPDASGKNRKSSNASESDLSLLRSAGFAVCVNSRNPAIRDRILSMNRMIANSDVRRYHINTDKCPHLVEALEKQAYNKHGEPDKSSGLDHIVDAAGYFITYRYPIVRRTGGMVATRGLA